MNFSMRVVHVLLSVIAAFFLFYFLVVHGQTGGRIWLLALAAASGVVTVWRRDPIWLAGVVPLGPILDSPFLTADRSIYLTEVVLLAAIAAGAARQRSTVRGDTPGRLLPGRPVQLLAMYAVVGALALLLGHPSVATSAEGLRGLRALFVALVVAILFARWSNEADDSSSALRVWTLSTVGALFVLALGGIVEFVHGGMGRHGWSDPGSFYGGSVALAVHVAFFGPLALSLCLAPLDRHWRIMSAAGWLLALLCLPLTASRGAMLSVAFTTTLLVVFGTRRWSQTTRGAWFALTALVAGLVTLFFWPELAGQSFAYKWRASMEGDFFSSRLGAWKDALTAIRAHPLVGEGPAAWAPSIPLELARRHGLPAALLALGAIVAAVWRAARVAPVSLERAGPVPPTQEAFRLAVNWGLAAGLLGYLIVGLAETGFGARVTPLLAAAVALSGSRPTGPPSSIPTEPGS